MVEGQRDDVPAAVGGTAYRIVQESLTNVARHAAATTVTVSLGRTAGMLTIRVDDDGIARSDTPPVPGLGLQGMQERVHDLGGRLQAEARPEGGFTVFAELPLAGTP